MPATQTPSRDSILADPDALNCTIYRAHETDPDGEERDMGDARVIIPGQFEPPQEWDAAVTEQDGSISMFYVCERLDDDSYVLLREEDDEE